MSFLNVQWCNKQMSKSKNLYGLDTRNKIGIKQRGQ
jgi:hypothetical protein